MGERPMMHERVCDERAKVIAHEARRYAPWECRAFLDLLADRADYKARIAELEELVREGSGLLCELERRNALLEEAKTDD